MSARKARHRLQCGYCLAAFWTRDADQQWCSVSCAAKSRCKEGSMRLQTPPLRQEPSSLVDRMLEAAKAARLAEERRNGQRRYTIADGWAQKPGRTTFDGAVRACEVALE
jgi:hypothetical protein